MAVYKNSQDTGVSYKVTGVCLVSTVVDLQVFQVFLDAPEGIGALLELSDLFVGQGHVDDAAHPAAVEHAGEAQVHLLADTVHALRTTKYMI